MSLLEMNYSTGSVSILKLFDKSYKITTEVGKLALPKLCQIIAIGG
jgi:capsule polysaccharide export protein KpsC/LpsZ